MNNKFIQALYFFMGNILVTLLIFTLMVPQGGTPGSDGQPGATGQPGSNGVPGEQGEPGLDGEAGSFISRYELEAYTLPVIPELDEITNQSSYITSKIAEGFIPLANSDDLDSIRDAKTSHTMAEGTPFGGLYDVPGLNGKYILVNDLVIPNDFPPIGEKIQLEWWAIITKSGFSGVLDGAGYTLSNATPSSINDTTIESVFGFTYGAIFQNLNIDLTINNVNEVFGFIAVGGQTLFNRVNTNILFNATSASEYRYGGGLIAQVERGLGEVIINDSRAYFKVNGLQSITNQTLRYVGGFIGEIDDNASAVILNSTGILDTEYVFLTYAGGIVGELDEGRLQVYRTHGRLQSLFDFTNASNDNLNWWDYYVYDFGGIVGDLYEASTFLAVESIGEVDVTYDLNLSLNANTINFQEIDVLHSVGGVVGTQEDGTISFLKDVIGTVDFELNFLIDGNQLGRDSIIGDAEEIGGLIGEVEDENSLFIAVNSYGFVNIETSFEFVSEVTRDFEFNFFLFDIGGIVGYNDYDGADTYLVDTVGILFASVSEENISDNVDAQFNYLNLGYAIGNVAAKRWIENVYGFGVVTIKEEETILNGVGNLLFSNTSTLDLEDLVSGDTFVFLNIWDFNDVWSDTETLNEFGIPMLQNVPSLENIE
jgi:hypothetical protein